MEQPRPGLGQQRGWRIDYHLATPGLAALARSAAVYKDERFSDHAPLTVNYDFSV